LLFFKVGNFNMRFNYRTKLQKLSLSLIALFIITLLFLFYQKYMLSIIPIILVIVLCIVWCRELEEELIIYRLKRGAGKGAYNSLINEFAKKGEAALSRLSKKGIVDIIEDSVEIKNINHNSSFMR